jgi:hypothetical protein
MSNFCRFQRWGALRASLAVASFVCCAVACLAQNYSIDWHTLGGGGGTSTGGSYSLTGTVGQSDTGAMSGGNFSLQGGFWSVTAVAPTPGAPTLRVLQSPGLVEIAWSKPADGWVLESSPALSGAGLKWTPVAQPPVDAGSYLLVSLGAPGGAAFFRLYKP